jgi:hypothetical protein
VLIVLALVGCGPAASPSVGTPSAADNSAVAPSGGPAVNPADAQPGTEEIVAAIKEIVAKNSEDVVVDRVQDIKVARDARGRWWASALVVPADGGTDAANIYVFKEGADWKLFSLGTGIQDSDIPADVRGNL